MRVKQKVRCFYRVSRWIISQRNEKINNINAQKKCRKPLNAIGVDTFWILSASVNKWKCFQRFLDVSSRFTTIGHSIPDMEMSKNAERSVCTFTNYEKCMLELSLPTITYHYWAICLCCQSVRRVLSFMQNYLLFVGLKAFCLKNATNWLQ